MLQTDKPEHYLAEGLGHAVRLLASEARLLASQMPPKVLFADHRSPHHPSHHSRHCGRASLQHLLIP
jgi:hypothetical protein